MVTQEKYVYAVTTVRIKEMSLLSTDFQEQLLSADRYEDVRRLLSEHGWLKSTSEDDEGQLQQMLIDCRDLLWEISPEPQIFEVLILKNDFHNIKAALKCSYAEISPERYLIKPCLYDTDEITSAVSDRNFDALPEPLRNPCIQAHDVFMRTHDGQYADVIIDTAALNAIREAGRYSGSALIDGAAELLCVSANLKTAVRAQRTKKDEHFLECAISLCDTLDKTALIKAALKGEEGITTYLRQTLYDGSTQFLNENGDGNSSLSGFEKWFDDRLMELILKAKSTYFGPDPLAAYYLAREAELRNIRILLSGKRHGVEDAVIRERMRKLYV